MLKEKVSNEYCEVIGIFGSLESFEAAISELLSHGFDQSELSVLASDEVIRQAVNYKKIDELADNRKTPKAPFYAEENIAIAQGGVIGGLIYVGTLAAAGIGLAGKGVLSTSLIAIATGASAVVGVIIAKFLGAHHKDYIENQLKKGGLLLWVHLRDKLKEKLVSDIFKKHLAREVHLRCVPIDFYQS